MDTKVEKFTIENIKSSFVCSCTNENLKCFTCEINLYHDSYAWYNEEKDDLLCCDCFNKLKDNTNYEKVVTFH